MTSPPIFTDVESKLKDFHTGLPMRLLQKHMSHCTVGKTHRCGPCFLARRGLQWMAIANVDNTTFPYSWLEACAPGHGSAWGLGCRICRLCYSPNGVNEDGGTWSRLGVTDSMIQKSALLRHKRSARHKRAQASFVLAIAGVEPSSVVQHAIAAPPLDRFMNILRQLKESDSKLGREGASVAWCLFEALRDDERKFLSTASCMSLAQDSRAGRLLTRWVACGGSDRELVVRSGVLQLHRGQAAGAMALQLATRKGLQSFATCRRSGGSLYPLRVRPKLDRRLLSHMTVITEVFVADGAADEQMAGELLRPVALGPGGGGDANQQHLIRPLPNLQLVLMDRAHASRRVLQRTWDKDEYVDSILKALIWDKQSLVRVLQNSEVAKGLFHDIQLNEDGNQRPIDNMGFAKQRFDSCAKPLARLIDHFDAATSAAAELIRQRRANDPMSNGATKALRVLTNEAVLQLGMLADCAEVTLQLTRFLDTETYDKAAYQQNCVSSAMIANTSS